MSLVLDIQKNFKDFSLDVRFSSAGRPLGILGASGSGKSMTLKCVAGVETPDAGRIVLNGRVLFDAAKKINLRPQQRGVGYLFQSYALFPHMTVEDNIACGLAGKKREKAPRIAALLARYQLEGLENRYPAQLSGGQQQRVALARIFACQPQVLLLDEPFSALDSFLREALQVEMMALLQKYDGDAVLVTHSRDEAYRLCADLLILDGGHVAAQGNTKAMFHRPAHLVEARLTGCKNFSRARRVGPSRVLALDWGVELAAAGPVPSGLTHVGVRAHDFCPAVAGAVNAIPVAVTQRVESPFEWNVLFSCTGAKTDATKPDASGPNAQAEGAPPGKIWWKYPKALPVAETPAFLSVDPEHVLLLA